MATIKTTVEEFADVDEAAAHDRMRQDNRQRFEADNNRENTIA